MTSADAETPKPPQPPAPPPHPEPAALSHAVIKKIVLGILLTMFLGALDQTIVATALPTIGRHFNNLDDLAWVVTAYLITGTAVTPLYGKMSDIHGRRVMMLAAIGIFVAGSVACALAPSMPALVVARALQGLGGGGLMALAQTIIADIVSPRERGRYQGYIGAVFAVSSVGGPVLGGFLTEHLDWSLIFWINLPLGLVALGMTSNVLKLVPFHPRKHRLDLLGAGLMMMAAVALLLALSWGGRRFDWISVEIGALFLASAVLWGLFAWRLMRARGAVPAARRARQSGGALRGAGRRLHDGHDGRHDDLRAAVFRSGAASVGSQSGLALIPLMGATVVAATLTGRAMMHIEHYKRMPLIGLTVAILALGPLSIWPGTMPLPLVLVLMTVIGIGMGTVFPVATVALQNAVSRSQMGIATGAANFFRALFSSLVVAILGAIVLGGLGGGAGMSVDMLARAASAHELAYAFRFVFLACGLILAFAMSFVIAMEQRPLKGPTPPSGGAAAPSGPATPIPSP